MTMKRLLAAAALTALLSGAAAAQTTGGDAPASAPVPKDGTLVQQGAGTPIEDQVPTGGLPGVGDTAADNSTADGEGESGPGGLQNGVGAVGTLTPSASGENPVPVEPGSDTTGIPLGTPATAQ
ncbi:hypothetical protein [Mangrovicella endophytica]|uniref:hypothetical protein n=1 Tax=Mangrovicella endophytica TaxID=2066697 RepID=UPI000C9EA61D|nr:hypothetical protein [Mangrovicella endophytica]